MRTPVINPQLEYLFPHTLSVYLVSSVSLDLLTCDREDLCTHLSGQALGACTVMSNSLIIHYLFFHSLVYLPSDFFFSSVMLLHLFTSLTSVSLMSKVVFKFSHVYHVFRFLSFLLTVHWLGYMCFPCSASFILISIFYSYGMFIESPTLALFVVIYLKGQVSNSYSLIQTPKTA